MCAYACTQAKESLNAAKSNTDTACTHIALLRSVLCASADEEQTAKERPDLPVLRRLTALREAVSGASSIVSSRSKCAEAVKDTLTSLMTEMWLETSELSSCLQSILKLDFATAAVSAFDAAADEDGKECYSLYGTDATAHYAVKIAEQFQANGLTLREENVSQWEAEVRALKVTRASVMMQIMSVRTEVVSAASALSLTSKSLLEEVFPLSGGCGDMTMDFEAIGNGECSCSAL